MDNDDRIVEQTRIWSRCCSNLSTVLLEIGEAFEALMASDSLSTYLLVGLHSNLILLKEDRTLRLKIMRTRGEMFVGCVQLVTGKPFISVVLTKTDAQTVRILGLLGEAATEDQERTWERELAKILVRHQLQCQDSNPNIKRIAETFDPFIQSVYSEEVSSE